MSNQGKKMSDLRFEYCGIFHYSKISTYMLRKRYFSSALCVFVCVSPNLNQMHMGSWAILYKAPLVFSYFAHWIWYVSTLTFAFLGVCVCVWLLLLPLLFGLLFFLWLFHRAGILSSFNLINAFKSSFLSAMFSRVLAIGNDPNHFYAKYTTRTLRI